MMDDDHKLDDLLNDAAHTYRVPPPPPLDDIWSRVEARAFTPAPRRRSVVGWPTLATAIAAMPSSRPTKPRRSLVGALTPT